jgi:UDP-glucuronate 4-epimerase
MVRPQPSHSGPHLPLSPPPGLNTKTPFSEDDRVDVPASLYAATKKSTEMIAHVYHRLYSLSVTGLRFFTVYGPWGRPDMAYMSFSRRLMDDEPIRIFQGPQGEELSRDFTFITDIVGGILGSMEATPPSQEGHAWWRVFNLGNTHPVGVTNLVQILAEALGKKAELSYSTLPALGEVLFTHANISAAQAAFGYQPKTDLKEGLGVFVHWYLQYYGADGKNKAADEQSYKPD